MPTSNALSVKTLQQAILFYSDEQTCIDAVAAMRWPDGVTCPPEITKSTGIRKRRNAGSVKIVIASFQRSWEPSLRIHPSR